MKKKNRNEIIKRQSKAKEKAKKKRQSRLNSQPVQFIERPAISDVVAPKGFVTIAASQAIMEYAKPLMDKGAIDINDLNAKLELASSLWNLSISKQKDDQQEYRRWMEKVKTSAATVLKVDEGERDRIIQEMIERYSYLFPEDIQPEPSSMFMYMRKDVSYLVAPFDYSRIKFKVKETIPPDEEDRRLIDKIKQLDEHIMKGSNYDQYEDLSFSVEDDCQKLFEKWLVAKGLEEKPNEYSNCLSLYITFIYRYMHDEPTVLKAVPKECIIEFFGDFLLRKLSCKPFEYLYWPPALKLFYRFLFEKGYLENEIILGMLDVIEPHFLKILQKRYN